ncbi:hypothetical protein L226DRAFT_614515 [Lentinus tigrinus ALCF2SS1-7]|uniref:Uncharacterized protein n=1 Tax=Lentinus tigrinus ALCF2SS1-6 TaxID=1328759 RepID=A0A5C2S5G3_9APHY|nr:hypothetical protein L227DRAFT_654932 [Lentinus tigrinus ALCF2SS1-6]RPD72956.1 hypothetical protein L226DRAFT_614515 [Lentinus tigrinus ALCF2SS1-7]
MPPPAPATATTSDQDATATSDEHRNKRGRTTGTGIAHTTKDKANRKRKEPANRPPPLIGPQSFRYVAPLPRGRNPPEMSLPIQLFDPKDFDGLPTAADQNPHIQKTRRGEKPKIPNLKYVSFTDTEFHAAVIPEFKLYGNIADSQLEVLAKLPTPPLFIVPHGGGFRMLKRAPKQADEILDLICSFRFESHGDGKPDATLLKPIPKNASERKRFGQPWVLILVLGPDEEALRKYLLWQQVFSVHPTLSFSVHESSPGQPWQIMVLTGEDGAVVDSTEAKEAVLAAIKTKLWSSRDYCVFAAALVARNWAGTGNMAKLAKVSTDALDLAVVRAELSGSEKLTPAYLVYAKPITANRGEYQRWVNFFVAPGEYYRGVHQLKVNKAKVECKLCKESAHCAADCPLPATPQWQGPTVEDIYQKSKETDDDDADTSTFVLPSEQAAAIWRNVPRRGEPSRSGAKGYSPTKKGSGGKKKDSRPKRR